MNEDIPLPFDLPAVARKKVTAASDGGRITSDGGVMLLAPSRASANSLASRNPSKHEQSRCTGFMRWAVPWSSERHRPFWLSKFFDLRQMADAPGPVESYALMPCA
jgi:hypothetical protein